MSSTIRNTNINCQFLILISCTIIVFLSVCLDETTGAKKVSRRRYLKTEGHKQHHHHHHRGTTESSDTDLIDGLLIQKNISGLRRSGRYICMEDDDEKVRLEEKRQMHCKCPTIYAPVCGNDGVTYHNRCFMQCTSDYKYEGFSSIKLKVEKWGPCDPDHQMMG